MSKRASSPRAETSSAKRAASSASSTAGETVSLPRTSNQALGIAEFAIEFMRSAEPAPEVLRRVELFHTDSVVCGLSALALRTRAPTVLKDEALDYPREGGATLLGDPEGRRVHAEKAVVANASAVREWDSNGTVFGYNPALPGHTAGEFGHNDFYPVVVAACQERGLDGAAAARGMLLVDEIRGRLCEVFSLKSYKIDHVMHGSIASCATYGAMVGATAAQIESAIGMVVAHYVPWRAIRAGKQLSDSKGASAALAAELAVLSVRRSMRGFVGPRDVFRNPESFFRRFEPTAGDGESPFDLVLTRAGADFAVMSMIFKLGLYENQTASALHAVIAALHAEPALARADNVRAIKILCYEPCFGIVGNPEKRDPHTRQSADHSMVFIVSRLLVRARRLGEVGVRAAGSVAELWRRLILVPDDYSPEAIRDAETRGVIALVEFEHGGKEYDDKYPEGIPTSVVITDGAGAQHDSGLVMFPGGHPRNTDAELEATLRNKFQVLGALAVADVDGMLAQLDNIATKSADEIGAVYTFKGLRVQDKCFDGDDE